MEDLTEVAGRVHRTIKESTDRFLPDMPDRILVRVRRLEEMHVRQVGPGIRDPRQTPRLQGEQLAGNDQRIAADTALNVQRRVFILLQIRPAEKSGLNRLKKINTEQFNRDMNLCSGKWTRECLNQSVRNRMM